MATFARSNHEATTNHVDRFEMKILAVKHAVSALPGEDYYADLLSIIRRPGWTTVAEGLFFEALVDTMLIRTQDLAQLHKRLMNASQAV